MAINRDKILQEAQKLVDKKRYDKAIGEYQKVVADDPNDVRTLLKIGDLYLRLQQFADAIATYDRVASYYSVQGFSVKAVAVYKQIREIIQKHAPHLEDRFGHVVPKLAELLTQLDLRSDALAYYDEMATRLQVIGRERDAIDVFQKVVALDANNPVSHLRLAEAYARVRDFDGATQEFAIAAEILLKIGRKDDAMRVVERILQYRQEPRFSRLAAEILLERGTPADAMQALAKLQLAFKANPRDLDTLGLLARAFECLGQPAKAIEVQKEAARIAKEGGNKEVFDQLLAILVKRAPHDEGVRQLMLQSESAMGSMPPSAALPQMRAPTAPPPAAPTAPPPAPSAPEPVRKVAPTVVSPKRAVAPTVTDPQLARASSAGLEGMQGRGAAPPAPPPPPPPRASRPDDRPEPVSIVEEISVADLVMDDVDLGHDEPVSEDEPPFALRASYPPGDEPANQIRELLAQVDVLRREGDYDNAVLALRSAVEHAPAVREIRERLCDVLIESGDQDGAIAEMLAFANVLVEQQDPDAAARWLDEVLLLEPDNRPALGLLRALGYAVAAPEEELSEDDAHTRAQTYDPNGPLPGYDLEELTADELPIAPHAIPSVPGTVDYAASEPVGLSSGRRRASSIPPIQLDDPFASEQTNFGIPSYPIDEHARRSSAPGALDESALEEIEFFIAQGMLEEADGLLNEQLARLPNHPLLLDKRREIEQTRAAAQQQHVAPASGEHVSMRHGAAQSQAPREVTVDRAYDIAHALDEMDNVLESFAPQDEPLAMDSFGAGGQISVEQVFEQFKAGVAAQIAESDAATHYDLGVAYKEMGLTADAIHEFELASRDPTRECVCQSMIGMLHMQDGNVELAIDSFILGLHASQKTPEQELALTYEIGNAYELRDSPEQALYYFQLVARADPSYRDVRGSVAERIALLERRMGHDKPPLAKAAAVGAHDEFDAAFDDLFNPK